MLVHADRTETYAKGLLTVSRQVVSDVWQIAGSDSWRFLRVSATGEEKGTTFRGKVAKPPLKREIASST